MATVPPIITEGSQVVTAAGIIILALRQHDLQRSVKNLWTELTKLRDLHMNGGRR